MNDRNRLGRAVSAARDFDPYTREFLEPDDPHHEGTWPNTRREPAEILEKLGDVPDDVRHAVSLGNVARPYGSPPSPRGA